MSDAPKKPWFAHKRYGYGTSFPISWEGWIVFVLFLAGIIAMASYGKAHHQPFVTFAFVLVWVALFILIARDRTEGGWRWRWGGK